MFRRPEIRYGTTPEPDTPYRRARQVWDDREGRLAVTGRRAWAVALVQGGVIAALAGALVWQGARGHVVPWVVEVDRFGEARTVGPATADFKPSDFVIAARLQRFIEEVRSVSSDPVVVTQNWLSAYRFTTENGAAALTAYGKLNDPRERVGKEQVSVDVASVLRASPTSFRVTWTERHYQNGALAATERWSAILTLVDRPTNKVERLKQNPLHLYVDAIDWSKEMTP
ncbi:conjugal transfer protein TrbF [Caulobacter segnis]|uniref:conjugal transfer protein TrbF n=1 Tax=Caulobacter segnis TaxID=88688 RepID=UPI002859081D|nr:conjugal transfer protein TrbF [Caulobacter segnis]MDR6624449.1 type IV secretion system protein VirB5 [Caulobacter segnis]